MKIKKLVALILVVAALAAMTACADKGKESSPPASSPEASGNTQSPAPGTNSPGGTETDTPPAGIPGKDTFYIGQKASLGTFQHGSFGGMPTLHSLVFDMIFWYDAKTGEAYSDILEEYHSINSTSYFMKVKEGVTFNDGTPLTGEDILFTLQSYSLKGSPFEPTVSFIDFEKSSLSDDKLSLTVEFNREYGPFLFAQPPYPVVSKAWCEANGWETQDWYNAPVGSGPYRVVEYVTDSYVKFELRDDYWGDESYPYKTIIAKYYGDASTMYIDLEAGAIDIAIGVNKEDYARAEAGGNSKISAQKTIGGFASFIVWNPNNPYLQNENIRKALSMAVDWDVLTDTAYGALGIRNKSAISVTNKYYDPSIENYPYDPEAAKEIFAQEGIKDGDIAFNWLTTADGENYATGLQWYLANVGVTLNLEFVDFATMQMTMFTTTDPQFINSAAGPSYAQNPYAMLINTVKATTTWPAHTYVADPAYEKLIDDLLSATEDAEIKRVANEIQKYVAEKVPFTPTNIVLGGVCYNNEVVADALLCNTNEPNLKTIVYK